MKNYSNADRVRLVHWLRSQGLVQQRKKISRVLMANEECVVVFYSGNINGHAILLSECKAGKTLFAAAFSEQ